MEHAPVRLGALQFAPLRGDVAANLREVERGLQQAADLGLHLVVLPEMWPSSFVDGGGPFGPVGAADGPGPELEALFAQSESAWARIAELSALYHLVVAGSGFGPAPQGGRPTNRLRILERGREVAAYDKVHLFSGTAEHLAFGAGEAPPPVGDTALGRVGGLVCYDLRFGPLVSSLGEGQVDILVVPAQWPEGRAAHWRALLLGRAVELQAFVVGANRTGEDRIGRRQMELRFPGNSLVASPEGLPLAEGKGEAGLVWAQVDPGLLTRLRRDVPIQRDRRPDFYRALDAPGP